MVQYITRGQIISIGERITFHAEVVEFTYNQNKILCSLYGEFFKDGKQLEPPMHYTMANTHVTTDNLEQLLQPIYWNLLTEQDSTQNP